MGKGIWFGPTLILSRDRDGLSRCERSEDYEQRVAGERIVRFMRGGECLKEITFDRFLELTGESCKR